MSEALSDIEMDNRQLFRCARCKRIVPWSKGCDDDLFSFCDDCWSVTQQASDICQGMADHDTRDTCWAHWWIDCMELGDTEDAAKLAVKAWLAALPEHLSRADSLCSTGLGGVERWALACSMLRNGEVK